MDSPAEREAFPRSMVVFGSVVAPGMLINVANALSSLDSGRLLVDFHQGSAILAFLAYGSFWITHLWLVGVVLFLLTNASKGYRFQPIDIVLIVVLGGAMLFVRWCLQRGILI